MKIGMIGAGRVAQSVARYAVAAGWTVVLSSRGQSASVTALADSLGPGVSVGSIEEAARADLVLLAVPWPNIEEALRGLPDWNGRILIDATNPFASVDPKLVLADLGGRSASEIVADLAPGARVVKAFNSIPMVYFDQGPNLGDARRVLFLSGDDADAKSAVRALIEGFGFAVIDLGYLAAGGRMQQAGGPLAGPPILLAG